MEPWRHVDAHNGGVEAQNGSHEGSVDQWSKISTLVRSRIRIRISVKSWICIRITMKIWIQIRTRVIRIRNPA